jgi:hypothetical protein
MAEKGIFTQQGLTPLDSVYNTGVWKVFEVLSLLAAKEKYKYEIEKMEYDKANKKNKVK